MVMRAVETLSGVGRPRWHGLEGLTGMLLMPDTLFRMRKASVEA